MIDCSVYPGGKTIFSRSGIGYYTNLADKRGINTSYTTFYTPRSKRPLVGVALHHIFAIGVISCFHSAAKLGHFCQIDSRKYMENCLATMYIKDKLYMVLTMYGY